MSENLNNSEKEFLQIFRQHKSKTGDNLSMSSINQQIHKFMSPANYMDMKNILKSLESKGFIEIDRDQVFLTQLGEDYLWRS
ncbi:MAG: hypothetical protein ABSG94_06025 [Brevinematales bacterium]|jgi:hypothetical protein